MRTKKKTIATEETVEMAFSVIDRAIAKAAKYTEPSNANPMRVGQSMAIVAGTLAYAARRGQDDKLTVQFLHAAQVQSSMAANLDLPPDLLRQCELLQKRCTALLQEHLVYRSRTP